MTVPPVTFGPNGFVLPTESEILDALLADINVALGGNVNPGLTTPQGQIATSVAAITGDQNATFLWITTQVDPAYNSGRMQDAIGRIYFIDRIAGAPTTVTATCSGLTGTVIPVGALARAEDGNLYVCQDQGTIPAGGTVDLTFACAVDGPIPCVSGTLNTIYQTVIGWDSIANAEDGALGRNVETAAEFEERRRLSTAINATGHLPAILGAVLQVEDVLDAYVTENDISTPVSIGGVLVNANSIYVCALGGESQEIGEAIWSRKAPGAGYTGDTSVTVLDPSPEYVPPVPSYTVLFQRPDVVTYVVFVTMRDNNGVPSDGLAQVQAAVISAFAGADGGSRAKIGSTVFASRYYGPVALLGAWAQQIVSIQIGRIGSGAIIVGSITGNTLDVSSVSGGMLVVGQALTDIPGNVQSGTLITALASGTGGVGTYTVSQTQTLSSDILFLTNLFDSDQLDIDEAPTVTANSISLNLV